eukprot:gnl/TRDRNA2_/TRDRNA2_172907_c0_seq1.p1 gnl/TRDRNA2_/TRDRNA2_172907_c0~~gnl/TRDRNA2_/TRDRNA2_172907_c0_seq1.p1  ORF type:complete len:717 (-),score=105.75 gnl/TRDRNA2_/TRDRNA2_172907_c0_seq1:422-2572(-)
MKLCFSTSLALCALLVAAEECNSEDGRASSPCSTHALDDAGTSYELAAANISEESLHLLQTKFSIVRATSARKRYGEAGKPGKAMCKKWCTKNKKKTWSQKCTSRKCKGCNECKDQKPPTPAPTAAPTPGPTPAPTSAGRRREPTQVPTPGPTSAPTFSNRRRDPKQVPTPPPSPPTGLSDSYTRVVFSGEGKPDYWSTAKRSFPDPAAEKGKDDLVRLHNVYRPLWQKTLKCVGGSRDGCEACSSDVDCWSSKAYNGKKEQVIKTSGGNVFNRFLNIMHVRCASPSIHIKMRLKKLVNGNINIEWDGERVKRVAGLDKFSGKSFAGPLVIEKTIKVNSVGAHELVFEFSADGAAGDAIIEELAVFMPTTYATCEDVKACLSSIGNSAPAIWLRNSNRLQKNCLAKAFGQMSASEKQVCEIWRKCLAKSGGHDGQILALLEAAGVDGSGTAVAGAITNSQPVMCEMNVEPKICQANSWSLSRHYSAAWHGAQFSTSSFKGVETCKELQDCNFVSWEPGYGSWPTKVCKLLKDGRTKNAKKPRVWIKTAASTCQSMKQKQRKMTDEKDCIDPRSADPESWDCDCFEEMHKRCKDKEDDHNVHGFSTAICLRAMFCENPKVCQNWKALFCNTERMQSIRQVIAGGNLFMTQRYGVVDKHPDLLNESTNTEDAVEASGDANGIAAGLEISKGLHSRSLVVRDTNTDDNLDSTSVRKACN